jgi:hypothetical protein
MDVALDLRHEVEKLHQSEQSWRGVATKLGRTGAYWWRVAHGKIVPNIEDENQLRAVLGLPPRPALDLVARCPHHPDEPPHNIADCNGVAGTPTMLPEGATIAPAGTRVVRQGPKRVRHWKVTRLAVFNLPPEIDKWWRGLSPLERAAVISERGWKALSTWRKP